MRAPCRAPHARAVDARAELVLVLGADLESARLELQLERDLVPAAAFAINPNRDFFSARIGCQVYVPVSGIDLAALCLRH